MKMQFSTLMLQCRQSREVIEFSPQVSFFHGQISSGKSSIARLIDYCLGGDLEDTPAISQELVSVTLTARIGEHEVLLEREAKQSNQVQVTWRGAAGESATVLAPIKSSRDATPIWGEDIFRLSDLLYFLTGFRPQKVHRSKAEDDSPLIRLSFRDVLWYCYLDQNRLDSSFFNLEDPMRRPKSRDVMRFLVGYHSEKLNQLQIDLQGAEEQRSARLNEADRLREILEKLGYASKDVVAAEIVQLRGEVERLTKEREAARPDLGDASHPIDGLRQKLRTLTEAVAAQEDILSDIDQKLVEQRALRAEIISAKFKLARAASASSILAGVTFQSCPSCGQGVAGRGIPTDACQLCGQPTAAAADPKAPQGEIVSRDLTARLVDLDDSIDRHEKARKRQARVVDQIRAEKLSLDRRLSEEMAAYDSAVMARARDFERQVATLEERIRGLERTQRLPEAVTKLEAEADEIAGKIQRLRREVEAEKKSLTSADANIAQIEQEYLNALRAVGVPGVGNDRVTINRETWIPSIESGARPGVTWNFNNAGSGGKKTMVKVCYALAVHRVAVERGLPLPSFIIIDSPMKNISEDVNRDIFVAFYRYLYRLASGPMRDSQFIIIDREFIGPDQGVEVDVRQRYMAPNDDEHPPLISYYRGP